MYGLDLQTLTLKNCSDFICTRPVLINRVGNEKTFLSWLFLFPDFWFPFSCHVMYCVGFILFVTLHKWPHFTRNDNNTSIFIADIRQHSFWYDTTWHLTHWLIWIYILKSMYIVYQNFCCKHAFKCTGFTNYIWKEIDNRLKQHMATNSSNSSEL